MAAACISELGRFEKALKLSKDLTPELEISGRKGKDQRGGSRRMRKDGGSKSVEPEAGQGREGCRLKGAEMDRRAG